MQSTILQRIQQLATLTGVPAQADSTPFTHWRQIPAKSQGIYIIHDDQQVYYVGKGQIRSRQDKHWQKALAEFRDARDTVGWGWLRENHTLQPDRWQLVTVAGLGHTARAAFEGMLIHWLQPLANDETYMDRKA